MTVDRVSQPHRRAAPPVGRAHGRPASPMDHVAEVAGVPVAVTTMIDAVAWLGDWIEQRRGGVGVRLVNAYTIASAHRDPAYLELLTGANGVSLPDGTPVTLAQRLLRREPGAGRVRGPSFFTRMLEATQHDGTRHFFLGTTPGTLQLLQSQSRRLWPELSIAGAYSPPFGHPPVEYLEESVRRIREARADCVWVALGTPKQDFVADRLARETGVPCIAVGAAFDFVAGTKRSAPRWMQAIGAEWLHRLLTEPRRLWRRYLIGNATFLSLLVRHRKQAEPLVRH